MTDATNPTPALNLPKFTSCKTVQAALINAVHGDALVLASGDRIEVDLDWLQRHKPQAGNVFIAYPDGYRSVCPIETFTRDYVPTADWGLPLSQEDKYTVNARGRLVNRETGQPIPDHEPVFIFRAQDSLAIEALDRYWEAVQNQSYNEQHAGKIERRAMAFRMFGVDHPESVKEPS